MVEYRAPRRNFHIRKLFGIGGVAPVGCRSPKHQLISEQTAGKIGIRQTRFVKGVYTLTGDDVLEGAAFPDSIAMGANPVIHYFGYRRFLTHEGYEIPYRCLVPEKTDGLLVAGRCMSSDQIAYESWRAMAHILNIGEAAGTAAALSARTDVQPRKLDVSLLQKALIENGAEIGQGRTTPSAAVRSYTE